MKNYLYTTEYGGILYVHTRGGMGYCRNTGRGLGTTFAYILQTDRRWVERDLIVCFPESL
jgi:lauroyl/myristoyl acyltransferase